jgi:hypothetical protein
MSRRIAGFVLVCIVAASIVTAGGCSKRRVNRPQTFPVKGVVTMGGEPLAGATVMFNPVASGGSGAIALTDDQGRYKLTTFDSGDGAVAGEYRVAFVKTIFPKQEGVDPMVAMSGDPKNVLPLKLADSEKSGFTATVAEGPDNTFDFSLDK